MDKINKILASIVLALFIISISSLITINLRGTYNFFLKDLKVNSYNLSPKEMVDNYNILLDYLNKRDIKNLDFIELPQSDEGRQHFLDVKNIFIKLQVLEKLTFILLVAYFLYFARKKDLSFIKIGSGLSLIIPILVGIPALINFDFAFTSFHKLIFTNDYWLFDPRLDPIIEYLPESLFFMNAFIIIGLIILFIVFFLSMEKIIKKYHI